MGDRWTLHRAECVLVVVDIQEKLAARMAERDAVVAAARALILAARRLEVPILVTEQYPRGIGLTLPELRDALGESCVPIEKLSFGCAAEPQFLDRLRALRRNQVVLCGMEAHVCVLQTALGLLDKGSVVHVAADAVCSRNPEHKRIALDLMRQAGVAITSWESAAFQWLGKAGTPEFKDLLPLFK